MPNIEDRRFSRAVILVCSHDEEGAMGFILNQKVHKPSFKDIYEELNLKEEAKKLEKSGYKIEIFQGGPVEKGRGFVLHSRD